jgi:hypothetical protein
MTEETKDIQVEPLSEETSLAPISETSIEVARANLSIEAQSLLAS